jgi:hypothetical protein
MSKIPLPGGVNLWGVSSLYVNPVNVLNILTKVLAEDKSKFLSLSKETRMLGLSRHSFSGGGWFGGWGAKTPSYPD